MNRSIVLWMTGGVVLALVLGACASGKQYTADALPEESLTFRWGGGFTGEVKEYVLLPNGQLFHRRRVIETLPLREVESLKKKEAKELFATFEALDAATLAYDDPGNMTYTIEHLNASDTTALTWGGENLKPSEAVRTYWRRSMQLLSDREPVLPEASK